MKNTQNTRSIRHKIIRSVMIIIAISITTSLICTTVYFNGKMREQQLNDNGAYLYNISRQLDNTISDVFRFQQNVVLNNEIQESLYLMDDLKDYKYFSNRFMLEETLKDFVLMRDELIVDISVVDTTGQLLLIRRPQENFLEEPWYEPFKDQPGANGFSKMHTIYPGTNRDSVRVITYVRDVYYKKRTGNHIGKILVHINYDTLVSPLDNALDNLSQAIIFDTAGNRIYPAGADTTGADTDLPDTYEELTLHLSKKKQSFIYEDGDNYYLTETVSASGWTVVGVLPKAAVSKSVVSVTLIFMAILAGCTIIVSFTIFPVVRGITNPLTTLVSGMQQVAAGDLETSIQLSSGDEIEDIADVFNDMVKEVNRLLHESIEKEKRERDMEIKLFMTEINPHFIYNTLNNIIYLGRGGRSEDVVTVTRLLISILQYNIRSQPYQMTTIAQEMRYVEDYIAILRYRYNNSIHLEWEVDEALKGCYIYQMLIYPIVENSVYHGIIPKCTDGTVRISITRKNGAVEICTVDDGVGISPASLQLLYDSFEKEHEQAYDHIGLYNVNSRLKLLYGDACGLSINSEEGAGTAIRFIIPKIDAPPETE